MVHPADPAQKGTAQLLFDAPGTKLLTAKAQTFTCYSRAAKLQKQKKARTISGRFFLTKIITS
jgi:hypothetical protein